MLRLLIVLIPLMPVGAASSAANFNESSLPEAAQRDLRGVKKGELMPSRVPTCPAGHIDQTHGEAYWWKCAKNCPGDHPWSDRGCKCACVLPAEYEEILTKRATESGGTLSPSFRITSTPAAVAAPSGVGGDIAPAVGTYIAPGASPAPAAPPPLTRSSGAARGFAAPSPPAAANSASQTSVASVSGSGSAAPSLSAAPLSLGPATGPRSAAAAGQARVTEGSSGAPAPPPPASWTWLSPELTTTLSPPESKEDEETGLPDIVIIVIAVVITVVVLSSVLTALVYMIRIHKAPKEAVADQQPMPVRLLSGFTFARGKKKKVSRVEPMPESEEESASSRADWIAQLPRMLHNLPHAAPDVPFPPLQFGERQVQPPMKPEHLLCPDVSFTGRRQKEAVMHGWIPDQNGAAGTPTFSSAPVNAFKSTPCPSEQSTRSPSRTPPLTRSPSRTPPMVPNSARSSKTTPRQSLGSARSTHSASRTPSLAPNSARSHKVTPRSSLRKEGQASRSASMPPRSSSEKPAAAPSINSDANISEAAPSKPRSSASTGSSTPTSAREDRAS